MHDFNQEYFFLSKPRDERLPSLDPDEDTDNRNYIDKQIPEGSEPLFFHDGFLSLKLHQNVLPYEKPPEILFDTMHPVVQNDIRMALLKLDIPNLVMNQSVYIDYKNDWYENLWYLACTEEFDCWDREKSEVLGGYDPAGEKDELGPSYHLLRYYLNNELLAETPLEQRLFFQMGGTSSGKFVAHASVAKYFMGKSGIIVLPIRDYGAEGTPRNYIP